MTFEMYHKSENLMFVAELPPERDKCLVSLQ